MTGAQTSWKDIKPVLSGFSSTQLLGLVQDLYRFSCHISRAVAGPHAAMALVALVVSPKRPFASNMQMETHATSAVQMGWMATAPIDAVIRNVLQFL